MRASRAREQAARAEADAAPPVRIDPRGKRILLVYLFQGLGDVVLLAPVAKALLDRGARVGVLVRPLGAAVLALAGLRLRRHQLPIEADPRTEAALRDELTRAAYDVAVDLTHRGDVDSRRWLMGATRLGWLQAGETAAPAGLHAGVLDLRPLADRHWSRASVAPLAPLGVTLPAYDVRWRCPPAATRWAERAWGDGPRVLLVPGSRSAAKRWPGWGAVLETLAKSHGARVIVSGAPWEATEMAALVDPLGARALVFTGRDLGRLLALVQTADLVLTNDTGPMHWAFACERPTIALFLHMSPECWGPPEPRPHIVARRVTPGSDDPGTIAWVTAAAGRILDRRAP